MIGMTVPIGYIIIYGLPLYFSLGVVTFIALISTATLGMRILKVKTSIKFSWHVHNGPWLLLSLRSSTG